MHSSSSADGPLFRLASAISAQVYAPSVSPAWSSSNASGSRPTHSATPRASWSSTPSSAPTNRSTAASGARMSMGTEGVPCCAIRDVTSTAQRPTSGQ